MKIKRIFLIILAAMRSLYIGICVYYIMQLKEYGLSLGYDSLFYYTQVMSYIESIASNIRSIFILAVVDFLFCVGQKNYNKSMLGISVALFALEIIYRISSLFGVNYSFFYRVLEREVYTVFVYYIFWIAHITLPFVGLAVAYIVVKARYLKSQSNHA